MNQSAPVTIHRSAFPDALEADLARSFQSRQVAPKFLYDSFHLSQRWLAVARRYAPYFNDPSCRRAYRLAFEHTAQALPDTRRLQIVALGCGTGSKEQLLLKTLGPRPAIRYIPCDVSLSLVLRAREAAETILAPGNCLPIVGDISAPDFVPWLNRTLPPGRRLVTFFGIVPNLEPVRAIRLLKQVVRRGDYLLLSANLTSDTLGHGGSGRAHLRPHLTAEAERERRSRHTSRPPAAPSFVVQYDNQLTRDWLAAFLSDRGIDPRHGRLSFAFEPATTRGPARMTADFIFARPVEISAGNREKAGFRFKRADHMRLFFSCRYTVAQVRDLLSAAGLRPISAWFNERADEGVFLAKSD